MDVKAYFQKIRSVEQGLADGQVVVVSLETPDGGRAGRVLEVNRELAAKMIVDRRARLADSSEAEHFRAAMAHEWGEVERRSIEPRDHFLVDIAEARKSGVKGKR